MKKNVLYIGLVLFFTTMITLIVYKYQHNLVKEPDNYYILERKGAAARDPQWPKAKNQSYALIQAIQHDPKDVKSKTNLAILYIQEARITGNYTYYDKAAMKYVNDALSVEPSNFDAMVLKSLL